MHEEKPDEEVYLPGGQVAQAERDVKPDAGPKVVGGQGRQLSDEALPRAGLYEPAAQLEQDGAPPKL